jgi:RimJ/RimL family protein N-acetyltransferase
MRLVAHRDARAFLDAAGALLSADEARHNLIYGICSTLIDAPEVYPEENLWTVEDDEVLAALLMTPPFNILVGKPRTSDALPFAAQELHAQGVALPGSGGALPELDRFADAWEASAGVRRRLRMSQGVYAASIARLPERVPGGMREGEPRDRGLAIDWLQAFEAEAMHEDTPHLDVAEAFDRRLASSTAGLAVWEVDAEPVSMCGYGGRTPHGIRIGPVYTPPELRGNGYASALTASVTQRLLDGGYAYCFLYTDLANPTSNSIYTKIGYELVCESADYAFD